MMYGRVLLRWLSPSALDGHATAVAAGHPGEASDLPGVIEGLELGVGLRNVGGHAANFRSVLQVFAGLYAGGVLELRGTGTAADRGRWLAAAHALRGACATIGALQLTEALERFEASLRRADASEDAALAVTARRLGDSVQELAGRLAAWARSEPAGSEKGPLP